MTADRVSFICLVADRDHLEPLLHVARDLGGAWREMAEIWSRMQEMPYLAMWADLPRMGLRAPLTWMVRDESMLKDVISSICGRMSDVRCAWVMLLSPVTHQSVQAVLFADMRPEGSA